MKRITVCNSDYSIAVRVSQQSYQLNGHKPYFVYANLP